MNEILKYGIATPFVLFNFSNIASIESSKDNIPRYFISLEHNRTCTKACTFKLTIIYVPDTFSPGNPTIIDNMIISCVRQQVTYHYGYYDYLGVRHIQQQLYVGQVYTYNSDINVANGTITYTVEGTSHVAQLTRDEAEIKGTTELRQPSKYFRNRLRDWNGDGFEQLKRLYDFHIEHTDKPVQIPNIGKGPVLDLIMGTSNNITKNNGNTAKVGGLVAYSVAVPGKSMEELHNKGYITQTQYDQYQRGYSGVRNGAEKSKKLWEKVERDLGIPYICYINDNYVTNGKYGTLYYVPRTGQATNNVFHFDYGNNFKDSDVLNFSCTYDGSVALAAASATQNISVGIDAGGNPIGASNVITTVNNLSKNSFPTLSGFNEDAFISKHELSKIMLYQFEATMTILGQIVPNQLLDIIEVVITINGTPVPELTGQYQILEINDSVSEGGFTTTFNLIRYVPEEPEVLQYVKNSVSPSVDAPSTEISNYIKQADPRNTQYKENNQTSIRNK